MTLRPNPPLDVVRVAVEGQTRGLSWVNTFWLKVVTSGTPTGSQADGLAAAFMSAFNTLWANNSGSGASTEQTLVQWNDGAGNVVDGSNANPVSGSSGSSDCPANVAAVLSWRMSQRYRGGHPRTYLAGQVIGSCLNPQTWQTAFVADKQTRANNFLTAINALTPAGFSSVTLGVLRQFANGGSETKPPTFLTPPVFHAFTSVIAKPGIATQRRRLGANLS